MAYCHRNKHSADNLPVCPGFRADQEPLPSPKAGVTSMQSYWKGCERNSNVRYTMQSKGNRCVGSFTLDLSWQQLRSHSGTLPSWYLILKRGWCGCPLMRACSVTSNPLRPHGLQPARLLCPWNSPGKTTGAGCHFHLQGIFLTQGSNPHLLYLLHWQTGTLSAEPQGKPFGVNNLSQEMEYTEGNLSLRTAEKSHLQTHSFFPDSSIAP